MIAWLQALDIPTIVLMVVMGLGAWILWKVQKDPNNDFNFEEMLRDENQKPSAFRLAIFISLAVSTWVIMHIVLKTNTIDSWVFVTYLGIWSGAKVAESALNAYGSRGNRTSRRYEDYGSDDRELRQSRRGRFDPPADE